MLVMMTMPVRPRYAAIRNPSIGLTRQHERIVEEAVFCNLNATIGNDQRTSNIVHALGDGRKDEGITAVDDPGRPRP